MRANAHHDLQMSGATQWHHASPTLKLTPPLPQPTPPNTHLPANSLGCTPIHLLAKLMCTTPIPHYSPVYSMESGLYSSTCPLRNLHSLSDLYLIICRLHRIIGTEAQQGFSSPTDLQHFQNARPSGRQHVGPCRPCIAQPCIYATRWP